MIKFSLVFLLFILIGCNTSGDVDSLKTNTTESDKPDNEISFPHSLHAEEQAIDCRYCHTMGKEDKLQDLPSINFCIQCHKNDTHIMKELERESQRQKKYVRTN